jgi:predicted AlkP superfamily pyrophosphatase or phosphodiesterase
MAHADRRAPLPRSNIQMRKLLALLLLAALAGVSALAEERRADQSTTAAAQPVASTSTSPANAPTTTTTHPARLTEHLLVISVDGLRPDMLLRCRTPHMHELFETGTYTFWARTTPNSITLPSHVSMLTGVSPRKHGIEWNRDLPLSRPVYPLYPTLFGVAKRAGYTTAMVAGKSKFETLAMPKTLDYLAVSDTKTSKDTDVAGHAAKIIREHRPQVMFVHFPGVDNAGHAKGWGTPDQVQAVEAADKAVGAVLQALNEVGLADETIVILSADHGGAGKNHGPDDPRARHIPWIINGPGIRKGVDLTIYADVEIHTEDTFATSCFLLGIPLGKGIDGHPVLEALADRGELLHPIDPDPTTSPTTEPATAAAAGNNGVK